MTNRKAIALGGRIAELRRSKDLRLKQLAYAAHISVSYLSRLEDGKRTPSPRVVLDIARALGCKAELLYQDGGKADPLVDDFTGFQDIRNARDLLERAQLGVWRHDAIHAIAATNRDLAKLTTHAARAVVEAFEGGEMFVGGFLSNILAVSAEQWQPERQVLDKMSRLIRRQIDNGQAKGFNLMQSLASALARKGEQELAGAYLRCLLKDPELRSREWAGTRRYYGNANVFYSACFRHLKEARGPVLAAWDLPTLMIELRDGLDRRGKVTAGIIETQLASLQQFDRKLVDELVDEARGVIRTRQLNVAAGVFG